MEVVGRAELKLKEAAEAFGYDFRGKVVLDIGSSTGGFTEYALRQGAKKVIAIEKGTRQMKAPLRFDKKVELHEKTDFFGVGTPTRVIAASKSAVAPSPYVKCGDAFSKENAISGIVSSEKKKDFSFRSHSSRWMVRYSTFPGTNSELGMPTKGSGGAIAGKENGELGANKVGKVEVEQGKNRDELVRCEQVGIDLSEVETVVADVSFVSLRKILEHAMRIVPRGADYLIMLKPQFEAFPDQLVNGVVKNEKIRREIIKKFEEWLGRRGFVIIKKRDNEVRGRVAKNQERFYWVRASYLSGLRR